MFEPFQDAVTLGSELNRTAVGVALTMTVEMMRNNLRHAVTSKLLAKAEEVRISRPKAVSTSIHEVIDKFASWLLAETRPVANLRLEPQKEPFPLGASRLVGSPDMPECIEWPQQNGKPLAFLAQINLADLPNQVTWPGPQRGWFYVFIGTNTDAGNTLIHRVIFFEGARSQLKLRAAPPDLVMPSEMRQAVPYALSFDLDLSLPDYWRYVPRPYSEIDPWTDSFPELQVLSPTHTLTYKQSITTESQNRVFGIPRNRDGVNVLNMLVAETLGLDAMRYWKQFDGDNVDRKTGMLHDQIMMERVLKFENEILRESINWISLFSLGSICDRRVAPNGYQFLWGDAYVLQIVCDARLSIGGDFSQSRLYFSY